MTDSHENRDGMLPPRPRRYMAADVKAARDAAEEQAAETPGTDGRCLSLSYARNLMQAEYDRRQRQWLVDAIAAVAEHVGMRLPEEEQDVDYVGIVLDAWRNER